MSTLRRAAALAFALVLLPVLAVTGSPATGATPVTGTPLFQPLAGFRLPSQVSVRPEEFRAYRVDLAGVRAQLAGGGARTLILPAPTGEPLTFTVSEDPVLDAVGRARYPQIKTYSGHGEDGSSVR